MAELWYSITVLLLTGYVVLDGFDDKANVLGAKGIGELGICGSGAAIANAVFNATGVRVRDFPITLEKVLPGLPIVDV